jgi:hypothetical protein
LQGLIDSAWYLLVSMATIGYGDKVFLANRYKSTRNLNILQQLDGRCQMLSFSIELKEIQQYVIVSNM